MNRGFPGDVQQRVITTALPPSALPAIAADMAADHVAITAVYQATRAALRAATPGEVVAIGLQLVTELGGWTVPAAEAGRNALLLDMSFGVREPLLAVADPMSVGWLRITRLLPGFLDDSRHLIEVLRLHQVVERDASIDALTGLATRRVVQASLLSLDPGDVVILIDLDHFKRVNDEHGHAAGDEVLVAFARMLRAGIRIGDVCGRYGGEEVLLLQPATSLATATDRMWVIRDQWLVLSPLPCTFSAGIAQVGSDGPSAAFARADSALYRAKDAGRDQIHVDPAQRTSPPPHPNDA